MGLENTASPFFTVSFLGNMSFLDSVYMLHVRCLCNGLTVGTLNHIVIQKVENIKMKMSEKRKIKCSVFIETGVYK